MHRHGRRPSFPHKLTPKRRTVHETEVVRGSIQRKVRDGDSTLQTRSLYHRLIGSNWAILAPAVQRAHLNDQVHVKAAGLFTVRHGRSRFVRVLARLLRLPKEGESLPTHLNVCHTAGGEQWTRRFGDCTLHSEQREANGGLLAERFGCIEFFFTLHIVDGGIRYTQTGSALVLGRCRVPLPRWASPLVMATEFPCEHPNRTSVCVKVTLPFAVNLVTYEGHVDFEGAL